jgi:hypothetical protein
MTESKPVPYICASCFHWQENKDLSGPIEIGRDNRRGACFGGPPTPRPIVDKHTQIQTGQANMRALTLWSERACGMFVPADALGSAANDLNG